MVEIDFGCLSSHRTIQEDGERPDVLLAEQPGQQHDEKLGPSNCKSRYQDFAAFSRRPTDGFSEFLDGFPEGAMIAVAVCGLEEHRVSFMNRAEILREGHIGLPEIAGEDDCLPAAFLLN